MQKLCLVGQCGSRDLNHIQQIIKCDMIIYYTHINHLWYDGLICGLNASHTSHLPHMLSHQQRFPFHIHLILSLDGFRPIYTGFRMEPIFIFRVRHLYGRLKGFAVNMAGIQSPREIARWSAGQRRKGDNPPEKPQIRRWMRVPPMDVY